jgi:hypothetical protein
MYKELEKRETQLDEDYLESCYKMIPITMICKALDIQNTWNVN